MLMEPVHVVKRRKQSLSQSHSTASITTTTSMDSVTVATTTPPNTPPTPPLNMMMTTARSHHNNTSSNSSSSNGRTMENTTCTLMAASSAPTLTTTTMASSLLSTAQHTPSSSSATTAAAAVAAAAAAAVAAVAATGTSSATPAIAVTNNIVPDHYSLRWNNHQNHILRAFDALLQTKTLVDVTLVCAETSLHAHKMVLSACSPFFQRVFAETPCKHPVIVLKDFQGWVVQAIVDFMYRGEISVPQERLQTLIQAGESLQVRGLVESSVPEHTPTPAASPDDFGMIDTSLMSPELGRCSSFDEETPSMVTAGSKVILPSRLFGSSARRERERKRKRERTFEHDFEREIESDQDLPLDTTFNSDICTSPMPRRKQARPRRRSGDLPLDMASKPATPAPIEEPPQTQPLPLTLDEQLEKTHAERLEALKTVIKSEIAESMDEDEGTRRDDSGNGNDNHENNESHEKNGNAYQSSEEQHNSSRMDGTLSPEALNAQHSMDIEDEEPEDEIENENEHEDENENEPIPEAEDIEELINATNELRRKSMSNLSEGPEDLCTTKKDQNSISGSHSNNDTDGSSANNNNNSNKVNNNNRIVLSLKDIRQLNKPSSSSTPNSSNNMHPFATASLRDLRIDRAVSAAAENQCKMDALEAQMHAAAAAAAAAAANGENPFQHMEHQMDLSIAAAAAAAAVSHQQSRERDQAMQREQREFQEQHNAYANSILGQMGMPGIPPFGPPGGPIPHERLEESMNRLSKEFTPTSPMSLPTHFNPPDGQPHPRSPLPFPGMSSALALTPPHMFSLDSPLGLFPPGIDPGKLYNPLMEMSDPRVMPGDHPPPFLKGKKIPRPKGQHSAPRGGPPRSWTNNELTDALQHVWNKKMTTSQASRVFGIPYNSLLMYVRGKYGKSLKLEQLRKDCISGPPVEMLQIGLGGGKNKDESRKDKSANRNAENAAKNNAELDLGIPLPGMVTGSNGPSGLRSASSEPDLIGCPNSLFGPFSGSFYPDFPGGFAGLPLSMLNLLPPTDRHQPPGAGLTPLHHLGMDEDCKSDRSKQSSSLGDDDFAAGAALAAGVQPLALNRNDNERRSVGGGGEMLASAGSIGAPPPPPPPMSAAVGGGAQPNGGMQD
ncbi:protein jim lovell isoform X1 [Anastrepha ludens]|uniref:protein jim lovell isoform X1 n=1 Tax=Anastrepha ludens TaxID=28586 RepID=UPI0023AFC316|nr:protein jim lovell isoform X1 [Anastrepha ludens]XP_053966640.1 protein jim lovell isoform X1 [Anastrepha ludens]